MAKIPNSASFVIVTYSDSVTLALRIIVSAPNLDYVDGKEISFLVVTFIKGTSLLDLLIVYIPCWLNIPSS